jgi:hypothetical protein
MATYTITDNNQWVVLYITQPDSTNVAINLATFNDAEGGGADRVAIHTILYEVSDGTIQLAYDHDGTGGGTSPESMMVLSGNTPGGNWAAGPGIDVDTVEAASGGDIYDGNITIVNNTTTGFNLRIKLRKISGWNDTHLLYVPR